MALRVQHRVGVHMVTNVADQQQAAAGHADGAAARRVIDAIGVQMPADRLAALVEGLDQVALHQAQPVAIDQHLVVGVDCGDGIFAIHDRGQRGFHQHVFDAGGVGLADRAVGVDLNLEMQAVMLQQYRLRRRGVALPAQELAGKLEVAGRTVMQSNLQGPVGDFISGGIVVRATRQRRGAIEEVARERNDASTADRVVAAGAGGTAVFGNRVGTIECVVQTAPAGVGGIDGEARIHHRHDQLRAGLLGDGGIDVRGGDANGIRHRLQIADRFQQAAII